MALSTDHANVDGKGWWGVGKTYVTGIYVTRVASYDTRRYESRYSGFAGECFN